MTESTIEIDYCVPCGFLPRAIRLAELLLSTFRIGVDRLSLVTDDHGVFVLCVDGAVMYDKSDGTCDPNEIIRRVRATL